MSPFQKKKVIKHFKEVKLINRFDLTGVEKLKQLININLVSVCLCVVGDNVGQCGADTGLTSEWSETTRDTWDHC